MAKYYSNATDLITFARSSSATYLDSDGVLKTAATDAPRIDYDADRSLKGLLIEEQRTNLLHNTDNPPTQVANLTAGSHTLSFYGGTSASSISDSITGTAVDVFVYDTSKDSDGGAWRHRTQHTSWYNEGASSTRGSRKEFPAVAVIVAEASKVTIYDGDDPSLPMWMVFNAVVTRNDHFLTYGSGSGSLSAVSARNGTLTVGRSSTTTANQSYNGITIVSFIADAAERIGQFSGTNEGAFSGGISTRNAATLGAATGKLLVENHVNDVAMTVLPDAPTDPATGLPVPTIAVASDGGVSVIKDDGTVVDSAQANADFAQFTDEGLWFFNKYGTSIHFSTYVDIDGGDGFGDAIASTIAGAGSFDLLSAAANGDFSANEVLALGSNSSTSDAVPGLMFHQPNYTDQSKGMSALTTSSYTTGWMNGDIQLAALADTTAETLGDAASGATVSDPNGDGVYDGNHIVNGDFSSNVNSWTEATANTLTWDASGRAKITGANQFSGITQTITGLTPGKTYVYEATVETTTTNQNIRLQISGIGLINASGEASGGAGTYELWDTFTAYSSTHVLQVHPYGANHASTYYVDNVEFRLADPDRSVNGNGLAVHGSITKAAVATGADVVGYSNFSSSNYLEQPYNPDLDFGTGDFCVMGWLKTSEVGNDYIVDCRNTAATVGFLVLVDANGVLYFSAQNAATGNVTGTVDVTSDTWRHFACVRSNSGTDYSIYVDGQLDTTSVDTAEDVDSTDRILRVGTKVNGLLKFAGSLALIRISATAPTADQIAKIYEDEKLLFQPNAKATLDGTSDAVTALAYDSGTDLLHVGTNQSRSVFYGLRRINQTGTAVTTAISAVDGLISEQ